MIKEQVKNKIISYINAAYQWHEEGAPSTITGGAGLEMIELEGEILQSFGLPEIAFQYSEILQLYGFSIEDIEANAELLFEDLRCAAEDYLLSPIPNDEAFLKEAKTNWSDTQAVLPFIGFDPTHYNCFLFHEVYFRDLCDEKELLTFLSQSKEFDSREVGNIPVDHSDFKKENRHEELQKSGLPFIREYEFYLQYREYEQNWNDDYDNAYLEEEQELDDEYDLNSFFITDAEVFSEESCVISILKEHEDSFICLNIWCATDTLRYFLTRAKYFSIASCLFSSIHTDELADYDSICYNSKRSVGKNIEVEGISITIERLDDEEDEIKNPFDYVVTYIATGLQKPPLDNGVFDDGLPF